MSVISDTNPHKWIFARESCEILGKKLVQIGSPEKQAAVEQLLTPFKNMGYVSR